MQTKNSRMQRQGQRLPWAVLRSVASQNRCAPPSNRKADLRWWPRKTLERLARIDPALWNQNIEWRLHANELDQCANVQPIKRALSKERQSHAQISAALRKAANLLRKENQIDPLLYGTISLLATHIDPEKFKNFQGHRQPVADEPRLSDFLKATADWIEGDVIKSWGVHRLDNGRQAIGPKGAAIESAARVRWFFMKHTGKPQDDLMEKVVSAYYPDVEGRDWASTLNKRECAAKNKNRKQQKK